MSVTFAEFAFCAFRCLRSRSEEPEEAVSYGLLIEIVNLFMCFGQGSDYKVKDAKLWFRNLSNCLKISRLIGNSNALILFLQGNCHILVCIINVYYSCNLSTVFLTVYCIFIFMSLLLIAFNFIYIYIYMLFFENWTFFILSSVMKQLFSICHSAFYVVNSITTDHRSVPSFNIYRTIFSRHDYMLI